MKFIYYYAWTWMAYAHKCIGRLFVHFTLFLISIRLVKESQKEQWKDRFNEAYLKFPGGIADWQAFGVVIGVFLIPFSLLILKFEIDINTNKFYYIGPSIVIVVFSYYWIYFKSIKWLKERIKKKSKKYYV